MEEDTVEYMDRSIVQKYSNLDTGIDWIRCERGVLMDVSIVQQCLSYCTMVQYTTGRFG